MPHITRFAVRSSGRDLKAVRRPPRTYRKAVLAVMNKSELAEIAEEQGLPTSGTKAEIIERLAVPESNDAAVEPDE